MKSVLPVEKTLADRARLFAESNGKTVSELVEFSPRLTRIVGSVVLPEHVDAKQELHAYFTDKHLRFHS